MRRYAEMLGVPEGSMGAMDAIFDLEMAMAQVSILNAHSTYLLSYWKLLVYKV